MWWDRDCIIKSLITFIKVPLPYVHHRFCSGMGRYIEVTNENMHKLQWLPESWKTFPRLRAQKYSDWAWITTWTAASQNQTYLDHLHVSCLLVTLNRTYFHSVKLKFISCVHPSKSVDDPAFDSSSSVSDCHFCRPILPCHKHSSKVFFSNFKNLKFLRSADGYSQ